MTKKQAIKDQKLEASQSVITRKQNDCKKKKHMFLVKYAFKQIHNI